MINHLRRARRRTLDRHNSAEQAVVHLSSGLSFAFWRAASGPTRESSTGLVLDAGSGRGAWRHVIESTGARREALDFDQHRGEEPHWMADLQAMPGVPSGRFDSVICHQVLEHVAHPASALAEVHRVLKPSGRLVLSVPHLSRLHDLPHDYLRFTPAGLRVLVEEAGFEIVSLTTYGGLLTFVHHQISAVFLGLAAALGPLYYPALVLNAPITLVTYALDRLTNRANMLPNGVIVVAVRRP